MQPTLPLLQPLNKFFISQLRKKTVTAVRTRVRRTLWGTDRTYYEWKEQWTYKPKKGGYADYVEFPGIAYHNMYFFCGASEIGHIDEGVLQWPRDRLTELLAKKIAIRHQQEQFDNRLLIYGHRDGAGEECAALIFKILQSFGFVEVGESHRNSNSGNLVRTFVGLTGDLTKWPDVAGVSKSMKNYKEDDEDDEEDDAVFL